MAVRVFKDVVRLNKLLKGFKRLLSHRVLLVCVRRQQLCHSLLHLGEVLLCYLVVSFLDEGSQRGGRARVIFGPEVWIWSFRADHFQGGSQAEGLPSSEVCLWV